MTEISCCFKKVTHCIFDMDGLLLDTERLYTDVVQSILDEYGKTFTWDVKVAMMGLKAQESAKKMVETYNLPITWEEYAKVHLDRSYAVMINSKLLPGVERLITHLHANKIPICVATSSADVMLTRKTTNHQKLFSLFNHLVCGGSDPDVKTGKPAPDTFLVAANRFPDKPCPAQCLVFEDSPNGVQAAYCAGMQCVMVPDPRVTQDKRCLATIALNSMEDFRPEQFGLPPFPS